MGTPIKLTKSFPAKASARAKVPIPIMNLYILTFINRISPYDRKYQKIKFKKTTFITSISMKSLIFIPPIKLNSRFAKGVPLIPFIKIKYVIAESAIPENNALIQIDLFSNSYVKKSLEIHCTSAPTVNAITTERTIPEMI